jgi:hypothetical protein
MVTAMLFSRGRLRLLRGDAEGSFSDLLEVGRRGAALGFRTVATVPWRSTVALALARLDRHDDAVTLAEQEGPARATARTATLYVCRRRPSAVNSGHCGRAAGSPTAPSQAAPLLRHHPCGPPSPVR